MTYDIVRAYPLSKSGSLQTYPYKDFMLDFLPLPPNAIPLGKCVDDGLPVLMSIDYVKDESRHSQVFIGDLDYSRNILRSIVHKVLGFIFVRWEKSKARNINLGHYVFPNFRTRSNYTRYYRKLIVINKANNRA